MSRFAYIGDVMGFTTKTIVIDKGWNNIKKEIKSLSKSQIKNGLFGDGPPKNNPAYRGMIHEYGVAINVTPKMRGFLHSIGIHIKQSTGQIVIPSRPFMRSGFDKGLKKLKQLIDYNYGLLIENKITTWDFLNRVGVFHADQLRQSLDKGPWKKLHPVTAERKGSSQPLVDTGEMMREIKHKIEKGG